MAVAKINGIDIYYERHGDRGEPLVFVHGYTGDISDWRFQIEEFSPTHRVLVMDLRGHGRSEAPRDRSAYTLEQVASDVRALIDHAGFGRFHLVGHSMGGAIAQEIALGDQERVITLTLEDTAFNRAQGRSEELARYSAERNRIAEEEGMAALAARPSPFQRAPYMSAERQTQERERLARMSVDAFLGAAAGMGAWQGASDRLPGLRVPTLIIYGELDVSWLVESSLRIAELVPGAQLVCIPQAAHSPQYERPDLFNAALRSHLERHKA
jgi:2-succinyl-6-hydroxy-2,4-cyclohexadiene-1-carboxylate synthase